MTYFSITDAEATLPTPPLPQAAIASLNSRRDRTALKWLIAVALTLIILGTDLLAASVIDTSAPMSGIAHPSLSQEV